MKYFFTFCTVPSIQASLLQSYRGFKGYSVTDVLVMFFLIMRLTFLQAEDSERTLAWYRQLQLHAQGLGSWRKRRNALANIMINGMQLRS